VAAMINESDIAYIQSLYPELDIKLPTGQQEKLLVGYFRGQSIAQAAKAAGYKSADSARSFLRSETGIVLLQFLKEREFNDVRIDMDTITSMFMESYNLAATSAEKTAATRELAKLHGLYPDSKTGGIQINVSKNAMGETNIKSLMRMSDVELAALAGPGMEELLPVEKEVVGVTIEQEDEP
jgi:hypothetical protein